MEEGKGGGRRDREGGRRKREEGGEKGRERKGKKREGSGGHCVCGEGCIELKIVA